MHERRRYQRLVPELPLFVSVEGTKGGRLLDLSEGGLAFAGAVKSENFSLAFDLPDGNGVIQARAEIAWTNEERTRFGVRFIDLAGNFRQRLQNWVSARAFETAEDVGPPVVQNFPPSVAARGTLFSQTISAPDQRVSERSPIEIAIAAVILCIIFVTIGYYLPTIGRISNAGSKPMVPSHPAAASQQVAPTPIAAPSAPPTDTNNVAPPQLTFDEPGYVIQVGAMTHEENADGLAVTLRHDGFPAFVFRHAGDRFFKVAVGPYASQDETLRTKAQLEKDGFTAIQRDWSPQ